MFVTYKCTQSIDVCLISDFEVAVYNILLPITCLVLEGEGKTWRTPESLEEAFNDCENGEIIMLLDERDQKTNPQPIFFTGHNISAVDGASHQPEGFCYNLGSHSSEKTPVSL